MKNRFIIVITTLCLLLLAACADNKISTTTAPADNKDTTEKTSQPLSAEELQTAYETGLHNFNSGNFAKAAINFADIDDFTPQSLQHDTKVKAARERYVVAIINHGSTSINGEKYSEPKSVCKKIHGDLDKKMRALCDCVAKESNPFTNCKQLASSAKS